MRNMNAAALRVDAEDIGVEKEQVHRYGLINQILSQIASPETYAL